MAACREGHTSTNLLATPNALYMLAKLLNEGLFMSICRSCCSPIKWIKTRDGKNMPVDPELIAYKDAKLGDKLVTETGATYNVDPILDYPNVKGYISHFATCPEADRWRKK